MVDHLSHETPLEVWVDGGCTVCQVSQRWCQRRGSDGRVEFIDFREADDGCLPMARGDHEQSMWLRDRDGSIHGGFDAWRRIMAELPGWAWLARVASIPPFSLIGPVLYRWVAERRHWVA